MSVSDGTRVLLGPFMFQDVVLPILTIGVSGVVAAIVTIQLGASVQRRDRMRSKLEEAYAAAHEFSTALTTEFIKYYRVFGGELDLNDANYLTISTLEKADASIYRRLEMLVAIYIPSAQAVFDRTIATREQLDALVGEHRGRYLQGQRDTIDLVPRLTELLNQLDGLEGEFKTVIVREARRLI